jgi:hypothetical protein
MDGSIIFDSNECDATADFAPVSEVEPDFADQSETDQFKFDSYSTPGTIVRWRSLVAEDHLHLLGAVWGWVAWLRQDGDRLLDFR